MIHGVRKTGIDINHFICYNKAIMQKKFTDFEIEEKTSGGAVYDCLLYTSPSPRDRTRSRMPSSA